MYIYMYNVMRETAVDVLYFIMTTLLQRYVQVHDSIALL